MIIYAIGGHYVGIMRYGYRIAHGYTRAEVIEKLLKMAAIQLQVERAMQG